MKSRLGLAAAIVAVTSTFTATALAQQPWIRDRRYGEGAGIRAGNLELHPSVAGEAGYDSNYFQTADDEGPEVDVFRFRLTPSLTLSTLGAQRRDAAAPQPSVTFEAGAYAALNLLVPADSASEAAVDDQRAHIAGGANFMLDVLPAGPWGFDLYGDYQRTIEPNNGPIGETSISDNAFDRDSVRLGAGINARPGGGLFDWRLGYEIQYHLFERDIFESLNNARHYFNTRGRWRFLPRTALLYDGKYGLIRYSNDTSQPDGETIESRIGINGLITYHFALLAMGGWAASFFDDFTAFTGQPIDVWNYDDFVAHAELKWFLIPRPTLEATGAPVGLSTIAAGYVRNFQPSYLGSFYRRDRGYLNFSYFIGGVAVIGVEGGYARYSYPPSQLATEPGLPVDAFGSFSEDRIDAQIFGEYRLSNSFGINTTLTYSQALSDERPYGENLDFARYQAFIGARWFM